MKQVVHVIRKADVEKEYVKVLHLELDYELATLYDAIQQDDEKQIMKSKNRLTADSSRVGDVKWFRAMISILLN